MKKLGIAILCLMSSTAFATTVNSHLPKFMKASTTPLKLAHPVKAHIGCDLYKYDESWKPTYLKSVNSSIIDFGSSAAISADFPAPYQNYSLFFQHATISFAIDDYATARPFIQSYIVQSRDTGADLISEKDATFSIDNASTGSSITLDNLHVISDTVRLYSVCSIKFIKA